MFTLLWRRAVVLMDHLDRMGVSNLVLFSLPPSVWHSWAVGYHATEAAMTMLAGFEATADWHRSMIQQHWQFLISVPLEPQESAG